VRPQPHQGLGRLDLNLGHQHPGPDQGDTVAISRPGVTFNARARGDVTVLAQLSAAAFGTGWPLWPPVSDPGSASVVYRS
jgi:hypothetical protein